MGIHEEWQIHTKTGFGPIKLQESRPGPHTNRMRYNNAEYYTVFELVQLKDPLKFLIVCLHIMITRGLKDWNILGLVLKET